MVYAKSSLPQAGNLQTEINRLFGTVPDSTSTAATAAWAPAVDVNEYADRFQLHVDLPGIDPAEVEVTLDDSVLSISGSRGDPKVTNEEAAMHSRVERARGRFHRRFVLPESADADRVVANTVNGVLEITIPKQEKVQARRIEVTS